jgi:hypothetical protein
MYFIKCTKVLFKHLLVNNHDPFSSIFIWLKKILDLYIDVGEVTSSARVNLVVQLNFVTLEFKRLIMFRSMNQFTFVRLDLVSYTLSKYTTNIHVILFWHVNVYSTFLYG